MISLGLGVRHMPLPCYTIQLFCAWGAFGCGVFLAVAPSALLAVNLLSFLAATPQVVLVVLPAAPIAVTVLEILGLTCMLMDTQVCTCC